MFTHSNVDIWSLIMIGRLIKTGTTPPRGLTNIVNIYDINVDVKKLYKPLCFERIFFKNDNADICVTIF